MPIKNFLSKILLSSLVLSTFTSTIYAAENCEHCGPKKVQGMPEVIDSKLMNALAKVSPASTSETKRPFEDTAVYFCMKFGQIERNQVAGYLTREFEDAQYSIDDYFQKPGCQTDGYSETVKSPMLHMVIDLPESRREFAEVVFKYYTIKRKNPELWLKAVNAKNTKGETLLDYIEDKISAHSFLNEGTQGAADGIREFICSHGGVYATHKEKKCP
jgi:hypothetical protein